MDICIEQAERRTSVSNAAAVVPDLAAHAAEATRILSLLGQETRFLILCHLAINDELTVTEIVDAVRISQSAVSHHLAKMRRDRLVTFRRDAHHLCYRIADPRISQLIAVFAATTSSGRDDRSSRRGCRQSRRPAGSFAGELPKIAHDTLIDRSFERDDQVGQVLHRFPPPTDEFRLVTAAGIFHVDFIVVSGEA